MTVPGRQPGFGPPTAGDEVARLDSKALAARIGASAITLGGLIKHLAFVEDFKLTTMLLGQTLVAPVGCSGLGTRRRVALALG